MKDPFGQGALADLPGAVDDHDARVVQRLQDKRLGLPG
jgi:hypothetical protein